MNKKIRLIGQLPNEKEVILGYFRTPKELKKIINEYKELFIKIKFSIKWVIMLPYEQGKILNELFKSLNGKPIWQI